MFQTAKFCYTPQPRSRFGILLEKLDYISAWWWDTLCGTMLYGEPAKLSVALRCRLHQCRGGIYLKKTSSGFGVASS